MWCGELIRAHEAAVAEALGYLEREACRARRGRGGAVPVDGHGFVAAAFRHRSSRAGDPLLHTHVVVANATQGPDGRWTALDGRMLYRHAKTAGYLYQAALRAELIERLGLRWHAVERGTADLVGVPRRVIEHFSQRRAEILEHMAARGEQLGASGAGRDARDAPAQGVRRARRPAAGGVAGARRRARPRPPRRSANVPPRPGIGALDEDAGERLACRLEGPDGLTRERSTFTRRDVLQAFAEAARDGARVERDRGVASTRSSRAQEIVELDAEAGEPRYTTRELLQIERELLDARRRPARAVGRRHRARTPSTRRSRHGPA